MYSYVPKVALKRSRLDRILGYIESLRESDRFIVKVILFGVFVSLLWFLASLAQGWRTEVPVPGGTLREGIVGTPRFVNPVLAVTRADKDTSALIYDGLMALGPDGTLVPNIAESITVSDDGLTYNVIMRKDVTFHDAAPLTALDVVFTVNRIKDPMIASPLRANFDDIAVEQVSDYELNFILREPYAPFIENLTFGILPEHIWNKVTAEEFPFSGRNSDAIGSGPYRVTDIVRSDAGIPDRYLLTAYDTYHRGASKLKTIALTYFPNDDKLIQAFVDKKIDSLAGIDPNRLFELGISTDTHTLVRIPLPRTFAIFFNQNKSSALRDPEVRRALEMAIDKESLVGTVLGGYGTSLTSPIPTGFGISVDAPAAMTGDRAEAARAILSGAGWKLNTETGVWEKKVGSELVTLAFSVATVNNPVFESTAEFVRAAWERIGVRVAIKQFEQSDLTQSIIRPRDYEALLFGTHVGRALDFYSFWHSSQRNDPGLNVALYTNIEVDTALTTARTTRDITKRNDALMQFRDALAQETPALFLYQPELLYVFPKTVTGTRFVGIGEAHERFASVHDWYVETESIWSFLR